MDPVMQRREGSLGGGQAVVLSVTSVSISLLVIP